MTSTNEVGRDEAMADSDNTPDRVIIRRCKPSADFPDGELIAFLPDVTANVGHIMSYMHIGQHGEASVEFYQKDTEALQDYDAKDAVMLICELQNIGYNVRVVKRLTRPYGGWAK